MTAGTQQVPADPAVRRRRLGVLARAAIPPEQVAAREALGSALQGATMAALDPADLREVWLANPFLRLTDLEYARLRSTLHDPMAALMAVREAAIRMQGRRIAVFCMPKSGSSFIQSALVTALGLPLVSLATFTSPRQSTRFGMNAREQELDELAIVVAALTNPAGYIAQHHTRCTPFLAHQLRTFGITPIVTMRNLFDVIVSFDDMILASAQGPPVPDSWAGDSQFAVPADYRQRSPADRYELLSASLGPWLLNFHLSWRRCEDAGLIRPLRLSYGDVLDGSGLVVRLSGRLGLDERQTARLARYVADPDPRRSRFNVGRAGRGRERLPAGLQARLVDYVASFQPELSPEDVAALIA